ncbi:hypothetical protein AAMO2058_001009500 [Amorphochlora amoebiformis]
MVVSIGLSTAEAFRLGYQHGHPPQFSNIFQFANSRHLAPRVGCPSGPVLPRAGASSLVALLGRGSFSQVGGLVDVISRRKAEIGSQPRVRRCALVSRVRLQDLDDSRKIKLLKALVQGRRKCNVKELAIQLRVDRKTLLEWFKVYARDPATIANHLNTGRDGSMLILNNRAETGDPATRSEAKSKNSTHFKSSISQEQGGDGEKQRPQHRMSFFERRRLGLNKKRISAAANRTMTLIYDKTNWPDDAMIENICVLHKLRKSQVVDWFKEKRDEDGGFRARH